MAAVALKKHGTATSLILAAGAFIVPIAFLPPLEASTIVTAELIGAAGGRGLGWVTVELIGPVSTVRLSVADHAERDASAVVSAGKLIRLAGW